MSEARKGEGAGGGSSDRPVLRIAHAFGNTRERLQTALAAPVDMIELDVWYRAGQVWVRHEPRLGPLPLLVDKRMRGHSPPPLSLPLGKRWYVRLDANRLRLEDVLGAAAGGKRLLVDVKGSYGRDESRAFARVLARLAREFGGVAVCGQYWPVLDGLRREALELEVRYSVERLGQWEQFVQMAGQDEGVRRVCIEHRFLSGERARFLDERGVDVFCWTVDDAEAARRLVSAGVDGIISNDLDVLAGLGGPVGDEVNGGRLEGGDGGRPRLDR